MAEKKIQIYDGVVYKDIVCEEILLDPEDPDDPKIPTGHYKTISETQFTVLGAFLDIESNYNQLKKDIEDLYIVDFYTNRIGLFTDYHQKQFLISEFIRNNISDPPVATSWFEWIIDIITNLGYINFPYKIHSDPKSIEFVITPKDGSDNYSMFFIPMDEHCYKLIPS